MQRGEVVLPLLNFVASEKKALDRHRMTFLITDRLFFRRMPSEEGQ